MLTLTTEVSNELSFDVFMTLSVLCDEHPTTRKIVNCVLSNTKPSGLVPIVSSETVEKVIKLLQVNYK